MISVMVSGAVIRVFGSRWSRNKNYEICICCFSAQACSIKKKSKDWLAWNQDKMSKQSDMSTRGLLF
jgi:hypothetical protein